MLKKISFFGFKSFADKVEVDFSSGITGVIGPNGCGKSNIFDGIRWVLGEQSAKTLRGGKMEDVIFSGSEQRKPRDHAEVTLTLDNAAGIFRTEDEEISVTRRVHRKEGSTYFINGKPARLKEVAELFMDSGVGSNSYSMIGQGEIGKILSTKTEERRAIFEEASGIVKLKKEKEQTESHLKEVDNDLIRIEDIMKELNNQLEPLRKQSNKAKKFNELDGELKTLEVQYLLREYDELQQNIQISNTFITEKQEQISIVTQQLEKEEISLEQLKEAYQKENDTIFDKQTNLSMVKEELEKINGEIKLNTERIQNADKTIDETNALLKEIEDKYSISSDDYSKKKERLESLRISLAHKREELASMEQTLQELDNNRIFIENDIEQTRKKSIDDYNELNQKKFEKTQLEKNSSSQSEQLKDIQQKMKELKENIDTNLSTLEIEKAELKVLTASLEENKEKLSMFSQTKKEYVKKTEQLLLAIQGEDAEKIRLQHQIDSLETSLENNDGFYDGVKSILEQKKQNQFSGVIGAIAELIRTNKQYEVAVETILQSSMQVILTDTEQTAKQCIEFLKKEKKGRATFKPLNLASPSFFNEREMAIIESIPGIRKAMDVIEYDSSLEVALSSFLGRVLIAENMDIGLQVIKQHSSLKTRIVTIEGEVIQQGMLTGGANKHQKSSFLTKRRTLEECKNKFTMLEESLHKKNENKKELEEQLHTLQLQLEECETEIEKIEPSYQEKKEMFEEITNKQTRLEEKMEEITVQEKELQLAIEEEEDRVFSLSFDIEEKEKCYKESSALLDTHTATLKKLDQELQSLQNQKTNVLLSCNQMEEEEKTLVQTIETFDSDSGSVEEKIQKLLSKKEEESIKMDKWKEENEALQVKQGDVSYQLKEMQQETSSMREHVQTLLTQTEETEKTVTHLRKEKEKQEKESNKKQVALSREETEKENVLKRLFETYEIVEEQIPSVPRVEVDMSNAKEKVEKLKRSISALGSINHSAIEDYEALHERYTSENTQLEDIKQAKQDLNMLLKNIEEEMTTRFTSTFTDVAERFSKIFVDLFEGGKASLSLVDENNPLSSAIEIIAKPPGKQPQSINLLSGGEKAFTAVALIFAIISAKPSPFVILDEVDAPLDDANVARFAHYLKEFSANTQFIVVTHRKGTKMKCDYIYGVTQETKGVTIMFPHIIEEKQEMEA